MQLEPQFHNVQLVPCMCPLTRDVIEQQAQSMMQNNMMQPTAQQQSTDSTKLGVVQNNNKGTWTNVEPTIIFSVASFQFSNMPVWRKDIMFLR